MLNLNRLKSINNQITSSLHNINLQNYQYQQNYSNNNEINTNHMNNSNDYKYNNKEFIISSIRPSNVDNIFTSCLANDINKLHSNINNMNNNMNNNMSNMHNMRMNNNMSNINNINSINNNNNYKKCQNNHPHSSLQYPCQSCSQISHQNYLLKKRIFQLQQQLSQKQLIQKQLQSVHQLYQLKQEQINKQKQIIIKLNQQLNQQKDREISAIKRGADKMKILLEGKM